MWLIFSLIFSRWEYKYDYNDRSRFQKTRFHSLHIPTRVILTHLGRYVQYPQWYPPRNILSYIFDVIMSCKSINAGCTLQIVWLIVVFLLNRACKRDKLGRYIEERERIDWNTNHSSSPAFLMKLWLLIIVRKPTIQSTCF